MAPRRSRSSKSQSVSDLAVLMSQSQLATRHNQQQVARNAGGASYGQQLNTTAFRTDDRSIQGRYVHGTIKENNLRVYMSLCIDTSGSMADSAAPGKSRLDVVLEQVDQLCRQNFFSLYDSLSMYSFSDKVKARGRCLMKNFDLNRLQSAICSELGGGTAIYDALLTTYKDMEKHPESQTEEGDKIHRYLVLFTDGEDNSSKTKAQSMINTLKNSRLANLHVIVLATGLDAATRSAMRDLCAPRGSRLIEIDAACSSDSIRSAFDQLFTHLRDLIVVSKDGTRLQQRLTTRSQQEAKQYDRTLAKQVQQIARQNKLTFD